MIKTERLEQIFSECYNENGSTEAEGIINNVRFDKETLDTHKDEIIAMLMELPDEFKASGGGGWSFLNMCLDRSGAQWADLHITMEKLLLLGIGIKKVEYLMPRPFWQALPGGVPYFVILDK